MKYERTDLEKMNDMKHERILNLLSPAHLEILLCVFCYNLCVCLWPLASPGFRSTRSFPELCHLHLEHIFAGRCVKSQ